ncbi:MAG TPA: hypothetical protein VFR49_04175, partial [Solirubrobacteraceae bacterium]|nr:hypothetical protein [Solirubrobacteraceae bacterium]
DAKLIVEEFKLRHERPSEFDLQPIRATGPGRERRPRPRPAVPRWVIGLVLAVLLIGALFALGNRPGNTPAPPAPGKSTPGGRTTGTSGGRTAAAAATRPRARARARVVILRIVPTGSVYVCLIGDGRRLIDKLVLMPGVKTQVYRAKRFDLTLGNGNAKLDANGTILGVPQVDNGIGYELTVTGRKVLSPARRPTCA